MRWNSFMPPSMRHGSCGTSGVSTGTFRPLPPSVAWLMCFMFMPFPLSYEAAKRRGAAAIIALRPSVFLKKSRLFFMVFPLQQLGGPDCLDGTSTGVKPKRRNANGNRHQVAAFTPLLEGD